MDSVVFDLDDTLIDTKGLLLPDALRRVAAAIGVGPESLDAKGKRIDEVLAPLPDLSDAQRAAAAAAWYSPEVPELTPLPGAIEALEALHGFVRLVLLTRGDPERQQRKIQRSGLAPFFQEIRIRPIEAPGSKRDDLLAIYAAGGRCVVVGDDARDELRHAADLGLPFLRVPETPLSEVAARVFALLA